MSKLKCDLCDKPAEWENTPLDSEGKWCDEHVPRDCKFCNEETPEGTKWIPCIEIWLITEEE